MNRKKDDIQSKLSRDLNILMNYDSKTAEAALQDRVNESMPETIAVPRELLVRISDALWDGLIPDVAEEVDQLIGKSRMEVKR